MSNNCHVNLLLKGENSLLKEAVNSFEIPNNFDVLGFELEKKSAIKILKEKVNDEISLIYNSKNEPQIEYLKEFSAKYPNISIKANYESDTQGILEIANGEILSRKIYETIVEFKIATGDVMLEDGKISKDCLIELVNSEFDYIFDEEEDFDSILSQIKKNFGNVPFDDSMLKDIVKERYQVYC